MKREFKIDARHQIRSFRKSFEILGWTMLGVGIGYFVIGDFTLIQWTGLGLAFWFVTSVAMTLPFHLQYLMENWRTKMIIDQDSKSVEIEKDGIVHRYKFEELKIERHLLGHHSPDRQKSYQPIPFDYYGYVKVKTSDKKSFIITSLMADPFDFPLAIDSTKYRFTFIEEEVSASEIERRNKQYREDKIETFMEFFEKLPDENLIYKIENKEKFEKDAVEAAARIMEQRRKITTANNSHKSLPGSE